jgi:hypothetical protein
MRMTPRSTYTAGVVQFDKAGGLPADHTTIFGEPEPIRQYVEFFRSALASSHPSIIDAYAAQAP